MDAAGWLILALIVLLLAAVAFDRRPAPPARRWHHRLQGQVMHLLMTASQINGLPVVTLGGDDVAEVRDVIYSPEAGRLVGLTLNKRGFLSGQRRELLPASSVHALGRDAVMVADASCLVLPEDAPEEVAHPGTDRNVVGDDVLTEGGVSLGTVRDLALLVGSTGEVVGYQIDKVGGGEGHPASGPACGVRFDTCGPGHHRGVRP